MEIEEQVLDREIVEENVVVDVVADLGDEIPEVLSEDSLEENSEENMEAMLLDAPLLDMAVPPPAAVSFDPDFMKELDKVPDRLAFKIGDVANIVGIKQYVLRYWETEFDELRPKKSKNNQRIYTRKDVENVLLIKKLLYRDRYSIEGAKAMLRQSKVGLKQEKEWKVIGEKHHSMCDRIKEITSDIKTLKEKLNATYPF